jgi:hypothetical protein
MSDVFIPKDKHPDPPGEVLDRRYLTAANDWYVQTEAGWFWLDQRSMEWKSAPLGPP